MNTEQAIGKYFKYNWFLINQNLVFFYHKV